MIDLVIDHTLIIFGSADMVNERWGYEDKNEKIMVVRRDQSKNGPAGTRLAIIQGRTQTYLTNWKADHHEYTYMETLIELFEEATQNLGKDLYMGESQRTLKSIVAPPTPKTETVPERPGTPASTQTTRGSSQGSSKGPGKMSRTSTNQSDRDNDRYHDF